MKVSSQTSVIVDIRELRGDSYVLVLGKGFGKDCVHNTWFRTLSNISDMRVNGNKVYQEGRYLTHWCENLLSQ